MNVKKFMYLLIPIVLAGLLLISWGTLSGVAQAAGARSDGEIRTELEPRQIGSSSNILVPNQCTPDTPDMVSYWPLDDGADAEIFEDVVGTNDGSCTSPGCPTSTTGIVATAFQFDGVNNRITVPDDPTLQWLSTDSLSFELWVKTTQDCSGNKVFLGKYGAPNTSSWWVGCGPGGIVKFQLEDTDQVGLTITGTIPITDDAWHHVVAIRDDAADNNSIYVDATLDVTGSVDYTGDFTQTNPVTIGDHNNSFFFEGILDEIAIYKRALTLEEIQNHYNEGAGQDYCTGNAAPNVTNPGDQSNEEGDAVNLQIVASDPDGDDLTYGATGLPTGLSIDPNSGLISGTIAAGAASGSPYSAEVTATDPGMLSDTESFTWTVSGPNQAPNVTNPGDQTNEEGDAVNLQIVASDPDGDDLTYGATGLPTGLSIDPNSGLISGTIAAGAESGSPYSVEVTVTDDGIPNLDDSVTFEWVVGLPNQAPSVTDPGDQTNEEGDSVNLQIEASDPDPGDTLEYSASGLPMGLSIDENTGLISGYLADGSAGSYPVTVTVSDGKPGGDTPVDFAWEVADKWFVYMPIVIK